MPTSLPRAAPRARGARLWRLVVALVLLRAACRAYRLSVALADASDRFAGK